MSGMTYTSVGRLVLLEEVGMVWFVGVLGLGMTRGVAQLDSKMLEAEMVMIAAELVPKVAMIDAEHGAGLVMTDEDKLL